MTSPPESERNLRSDPSGQFHPATQRQSAQESGSIGAMKGITAARRIHSGHSERWLMKDTILSERPTPLHPVGHDELRWCLFC